jgi:hypothetical protein
VWLWAIAICPYNACRRLCVGDWLQLLDKTKLNF